MNDIFNQGALGVAMVVLLKMGIGVLLGGAIGFEREKHGRPAGLRTHMLVALGVVLFTVVSASYSGSDPTRISAQVVTGIGFLGAGTILRMGAEIRGLTSAASIWATSAISMAVGRGGPYFIVATVSTVLAIITLNYVDKIEKRYKPQTEPCLLTVKLINRAILHDLIEKLNYESIEVKSIHILQSEPEIQVSMQVTGVGSMAIQIATQVSGVMSATWADSHPKNA